MFGLSRAAQSWLKPNRANARERASTLQTAIGAPGVNAGPMTAAAANRVNAAGFGEHRCVVFISYT